MKARREVSCHDGTLKAVFAPDSIVEPDAVPHSIVVANGPIDLHVVMQGTGPLILCVHGYPELSYSWRHQIDHFSTRGYTVAALDVRPSCRLGCTRR
jgi:pimeloyl-ACP methyl ester carboxylesterase